MKQREESIKPFTISAHVLKCYQPTLFLYKVDSKDWGIVENFKLVNKYTHGGMLKDLTQGVIISNYNGDTVTTAI